MNKKKLMYVIGMSLGEPMVMDSIEKFSKKIPAGFSCKWIHAIFNFHKHLIALLNF